MELEVWARAGVAAAAALVALSPAPAHAYLDPAPAILESVAARRAGLGFRTLVAEGYVPGTDPVVHLWTALRTGAGLRTERRSPDGREVELVLGRNVYRFSPGSSPTPPRLVRAHPLVELLGSTRPDPGGQRGRELLARMRIDPDVVSLARFDGRTVYVIGAAPGQLDVPQLWIDKRFLVPVRWIVEAEEGGSEDVRLYGYGMPTTGPWFPERIERWRGGKRESVHVYTDARLNADAEARLFNPPTGR